MSIKRLITYTVILLWSGSLWAQETAKGELLLESHLPIISIRTGYQSIVDEPKISAMMDIVWSDSTQMNSYYSNHKNFPYRIGIEIRGESSRILYPKKSYGIETRTDSGTNLNISLLEFPKENDWVLYGPYSDKSLLRNYLTYYLADSLMDWAPGMKFCELLLNNQYQGIYLFGEKIKRDKNRVDIAKCVEKDTTGDDLTGGYIIKLDKEMQIPDNGWHSYFSAKNHPDKKIFFHYVYPKSDRILPQQKEYIQSFIHDFELILKSPDFADSVHGYPSIIDTRSFVDYFIINELTKNIDAYRLSTFLYKDKDSKGGKLKIGPVWDYNLAYGNANFCNGDAYQGWSYQFNDFCPDDIWLVPFWWERLMEDEQFLTLKLNKSSIFKLSYYRGRLQSLIKLLYRTVMTLNIMSFLIQRKIG